MELRMIKIMSVISAIEWDSGGCKLVLPLSFDWMDLSKARPSDIVV